MLAILAEKIHDGRFLRLISNMLKAGYLEDWRWHATLSGAPQGGIASPVLSDIYLDRLDQFIEQRLLPEYNLGRRRRPNPAYQATENAIARARRHKDRPEARRLVLRRRQLPSQDPADPGYRRLRYIRYADDWLLGLAGPRHEAEEIKSKIAAFLHQELKLELSQSKTLITHATSQAARFLGYEIRAQHSDVKITRRRRAVNGAIGLFVPKTVIRQRCALYMSKGKPAQRGALLHDDDFTIVAKYQAEYRKNVQEDPTIAAIAAEHTKSPAQVMLRWHMQQGRSAIPKSTNPRRIAENFNVFDFELTEEQMADIDALDTGARSGPDPDIPRPEVFDWLIPEN